MTNAEKLAKAVALLEVADAALQRAGALIRASSPQNDSQFGSEARRINYETCRASDAARKLAEDLDTAIRFARDVRGCCKAGAIPYCGGCGRAHDPERGAWA